MKYAKNKHKITSTTHTHILRCVNMRPHEYFDYVSYSSKMTMFHYVDFGGLLSGNVCI